jgi:hypothetical protein
MRSGPVPLEHGAHPWRRAVPLLQGLVQGPCRARASEHGGAEHDGESSRRPVRHVLLDADRWRDRQRVPGVVRQWYEDSALQTQLEPGWGGIRRLSSIRSPAGNGATTTDSRAGTGVL